MGIFDIFTGSSAKDAAAKNAQLYADYGNRAGSALTQGLNQGIGALDYGRAGALGAYDKSLTGAQGALDTGLNRTIGAYDVGLPQVTGGYERAAAAYVPLEQLGQKYGTATSLAVDATGANGPEGIARAEAAFRASPGYQFAVDQATDAVARKQAALGMLGSGNTIDAIRQRAQDIANQDYGNWRSYLGSFVSPELSAAAGAASGKAGQLGNLAGYYGTDVAGRAGAYTGAGQGQASLWNNYGSNLGNLYSTDAAQRAALYGGNALNQSNVFGNVAGGTANSNTAAANAAMQGSGQFWNGLMNLAGSLVSSKK